MYNKVGTYSTVCSTSNQTHDNNNVLLSLLSFSLGQMSFAMEQNSVLQILSMAQMDLATKVFLHQRGSPLKNQLLLFLVHQAKVNPGKVTVIAWGPLTNIALA
ncbi:hypothetical protein JHK82_050967 [Glycine max]|nr:hypothetical protein JHK86_050824 [Glycine max]KAG4936749.1 hypothetical protein JHK85_051668 [Glycine max]KAG5092189.1 hypothetical protein JHK82_050967 [Glycine max]KAG5095269.1 hypothetical protein JHK84_050857 [Glycine max]